MNSPYKYRLDKLKGQEVVIHRANASDVKGDLAEVGEAGCVINQQTSLETVLAVFIAYENIRGVGNEVPDYKHL